MKRIAIIVDGSAHEKWLHRLAEALGQCQDIDLCILVPTEINYAAESAAQLRPPKSRLKTLVFRLFATAESITLALGERFLGPSRAATLSEPLYGSEIIRFDPQALQITTTGDSNNEVSELSTLNFDLIVSVDFPIPLKRLTPLAKDGIIFIDEAHRAARGEPVGFWEVYRKEASTSFTVKRLSEDDTRASIVCRGMLATKRSHAENLRNIYREGYAHLTRILLQYALTERLPILGEGRPRDERALAAPPLAALIAYLWRTCTVNITHIFDWYVWRKQERWGVAFVPGDWRDAELQAGTRIANPQQGFFADPFVITKEGRTVCFVEEYRRPMRKGRITAIELYDNGRYSVLGPVIEEPFHLSFPFLFEFRDNLYLIPESHESETIRLYKCIEFPLKWAYKQDLLSGLSTVDTMMVRHGGRWWLLTNPSSLGNKDYDAQLMAFHSPHPLSGTWTPHDQNPLVIDSETGRNGGLLFGEGGVPVRVRQRQDFNLYGASLTLAEITTLTTSAFEEREIRRITPRFFPNLRGCHHLHSNGTYTVYDFLV